MTTPDPSTPWPAVANLITYTTESDGMSLDLTYRFSSGVQVHEALGHLLYMNPSTGESIIISRDELDFLKGSALHTTHTEHYSNDDGTPVFETYVINDTVPPRFEENNEH